jgi:hypothetical protein
VGLRQDIERAAERREQAGRELREAQDELRRLLVEARDLGVGPTRLAQLAGVSRGAVNAWLDKKEQKT